MGVKQLWTLLSPVGRPVLLETMEGKTIAIDSSIWIYQFQASMRDKDGRALVNAHVLGFLRRICKLLFYGIKPVFVFDGGAPALKKHTIAERKRKKAGAADSHAKIAQKLLAAQMRREALLHVQKGKQKAEPAPSATEENTVYLEDLVANPAAAAAKPESAKKKNKFHDYDPYRLPEIDLASLSRPTTSLVPDPRLATEEELREFIDAMRPEDFDVSSPAFRELPTEIQYEIIGDLRLKSRQTSYKRLQAMLRNSSTPLDFSKAQIKNLKQRNALTQQLLVTTDTIGKANVVIPVRIASERNKEYILVKNEGAEGGWILGINDEGSKDKPIQIDEPDQETQHDEGDSDDMEEVDTTSFNSDLRKHHGRMALAAVAKRRSQPPKEKPLEAEQKAPSVPLFLDDDLDDVAVQELLIQQAKAATEKENHNLERATEASMNDTVSSQKPPATSTAISVSDDEDEELYASGPSRLETALAFANTPSRRDNLLHTTSTFGTPVLLMDSKLHSPALIKEQLPRESGNDAPPVLIQTEMKPTDENDDDDQETDMEEVPLTSVSQPVTVAEIETTTSSQISEKVTTIVIPVDETSSAITMVQADLESEESTVEYMEVPITPKKPRQDMQLTSTALATTETNHSNQHSEKALSLPTVEILEEENGLVTRAENASEDVSMIRESKAGHEPLENAEVISDLEPSSSPIQSTSKLPGDVPQNDEVWDAAEEMDIVAEEGDFAEFVSQMKNQDLATAQKEIDEEIKQLNKQRKAAMRDSEDVTQHMISQIKLMLRLFGLPYITAPMEAEAQCAALVSLGLVEGIITDDSDVFLFGGLRVYKNMFNQSKTIECFLLNDLSRELGLDRDKLIRLAYLLGSDYVEGLPGVGVVVAMELLEEFPGEDGLHKFKAWWQKVQSGKDTEADTDTAFRKRFKKRFRNLFLPEEWPNPAVRDAYCHPTVDESEEPFKWGLPDLAALHQFFQEELSWSQSKVDELLVPIIRKMGQRNLSVTANRQGTLNNYFDVSFGSGTYAPRRREVYSSKRLQQVVKDFRANQRSSESIPMDNSGDQDTSASVEKPTRKPRAKKTQTRKRRRKDESTEVQAKEKNVEVIDTPRESDADAEVNEDGGSLQGPAVKAKLRPRPKQRYKEVRSDEEGDDASSDDLFTVKRSRRV